MISPQDFYEKARQAIGGLYVWGGQGGIATEKYLLERARSVPQYFNGGRLEMMLYRAANEPDIRCWDCSGLVCWALENIGAVRKNFDTTANGLFKSYCVEIKKEALREGDLLFRYSAKENRMVHVGIYSPRGAIEAAGGAYGVIECPGLSGSKHTAVSLVNSKRYSLPSWTHYGRLKMLEYKPQPSEDEPTLKPKTAYFAIVTGGSVNVRAMPGTDAEKICVAHKNDKILCLAPENGWHSAAVGCGGSLRLGFVSEKYVKKLDEDKEV